MARTIRLTLLSTALVLAGGGLAHAQPEGESAELEVPPPPVVLVPVPPAPPPPSAAHETVCDDRQDDDGDGLPDCADSDCFDAPNCHAGGQDERTNDRCSDWVDNDGDGAVDCEDEECAGPGITVCQGSQRGGPQTGGGPASYEDDDVPELSGDMSVEDLIGRAGDIDGERNDYLCSDGVDNDHDGRTDCQDFGCRFDPSVTVCTGTPGVRLSLVVGVQLSLNLERLADEVAGIPITPSGPFG